MLRSAAGRDRPPVSTRLQLYANHENALEHLREVPGHHRVDPLVGYDHFLVGRDQSYSARLPDDPVGSSELPERRMISELAVIPG